jgi:hypothetical protein
MNTLLDAFDRAISSVQPPRIPRPHHDEDHEVPHDALTFDPVAWEDATVAGARWWLTVIVLRRLATGLEARVSSDEEDHASDLRAHLPSDACEAAEAILRARRSDHPDLYGWGLTSLRGWEQRETVRWYRMAVPLIEALSTREPAFLDEALDLAEAHIEAARSR